MAEVLFFEIDPDLDSGLQTGGAPVCPGRTGRKFARWEASHRKGLGWWARSETTDGKHSYGRRPRTAHWILCPYCVSILGRSVGRNATRKATSHLVVRRARITAAADHRSSFAREVRVRVRTNLSMRCGCGCVVLRVRVRTNLSTRCGCGCVVLRCGCGLADSLDDEGAGAGLSVRQFGGSRSWAWVGLGHTVLISPPELEPINGM
jgi:hypothetical protein